MTYFEGVINFDRTKYLRLRAAYSKAKARGDEKFYFEGHELLTSFAYYMLKYLEGQFPQTNHPFRKPREL